MCEVNKTDSIEIATAVDWPEIAALLAANRLPTADVACCCARWR